MPNGFDPESCIVKPSSKFKLEKQKTDGRKLYTDDDDFDEKLAKLRKSISERQGVLYADGRFGVLMILQGMDASGKDGAIKHIMSCMNPQGITVNSFGSPTEEERRHDFLWRTHVKMPPRGKIGVFNRSYYEEVVAVRVHPEYLEKQRLPQIKSHWDSGFWQRRFEAIRSHETCLFEEGYRVLKFFLHISREEQRKRLLERLKEPDKNWKFDTSDVADRAHWNKFQRAYSDCLAETSTKTNPWYLIPADDKKNARLMISIVLASLLDELPVKFPSMPPARRRELKAIEKKLEREH